MLVLPAESVKSFCVASSCDYQVFYRYYEQYRARFCNERKSILKNNKQSSALRRVIRRASDYELHPSVAIVPLIESSLNPAAIGSGTRDPAMGMWQMKTPAAQDMGLIINDKIDERMDEEKSTGAGLRYLRWLKRKFDGDHNLAVLAYHVGIGQLQRTMVKSGSSNAWYLSQLMSKSKPSQDYLLKYYSYTITLLDERQCVDSKGSAL